MQFYLHDQYTQAGAQTGGAGGGCVYRVAATLNRNIKIYIYSVDRISKILRDLFFSLNQTLKTAEDWYIARIKKIKKNSESVR